MMHDGSLRDEKEREKDIGSDDRKLVHTRYATTEKSGVS
jgi:hypothetical protein